MWQEDPTKIFTSLLLRPLACPEVQGYIEEKTSEVPRSSPPPSLPLPLTLSLNLACNWMHIPNPNP